MDLKEPLAIIVKEPTENAFVPDRQTVEQPTASTQPAPDSDDSGVNSSAQIREGTVSSRVAAINQRLAQAEREADVAADKESFAASVPVDRQLPEQADVATDVPADSAIAELASPSMGVSVDRQLPEQADVASADVASASAKVPSEKQLPEVSSAPHDASPLGGVKPADPMAKTLDDDSWQQTNDKAVRLESDQFEQSGVSDQKALSPAAQRLREATEQKASDAAEQRGLFSIKTAEQEL